MTADQIAASCRDYAKALRAEADALERAADLLAPHSWKVAAQFYAPWGFKKDGTPRKRPPIAPEVLAKGHATRRRQKAERRAARDAGAQREELRLNVLSSTHPTARELQNHPLVYAS